MKLIACLYVAACFAACSQAGEAGDAAVLRVIDGDTVRVAIQGRAEDVRLLGINSPEWAECQGPEAAFELERLLGGGEARLVTDLSDRDSVGRLLRLVYSGRTLVNEALVRAGLAIAFAVPPDTSAAELFARAEETAERDGVGIWDSDGCGPPVPRGMTIEGIQSGAGWSGEPIDGETVVIRNTRSSAIDLTGWTLRDASSSHRYRFGNFTIGGDGQVTIATACGVDEPDRLHWCASGPVWNDSGDHAFLLDQHGNIVDHLRY